MIKNEIWWETIFLGVLEVGINKEKLIALTDESFLYFEPYELEVKDDGQQLAIQK